MKKNVVITVVIKHYIKKQMVIYVNIVINNFVIECIDVNVNYLLILIQLKFMKLKNIKGKTRNS